MQANLLNVEGEPSGSPARSGVMENHTVDIFLRVGSTEPVWIGAAPDLESARRQIEEMAARSPGDYFVYDGNCEMILSVPQGSLPGTQEDERAKVPKASLRQGHGRTVAPDDSH